jgi:hypothetical protein
MNINSAVDTVTSTIAAVVSLGVSLVGLALVADILFPGTTDIVGNVSGLVNSFMSQGLVGLIALIVFVAVLSRD